MKRNFISIAAITFLFACNKYDNIVGGAKPVHELLTEKPWQIVGAGFDDNDNGIVDVVENQLTDCQKDNTYHFHQPGNGSIFDNVVDCTPSENLNFEWKLLNGDKEIEINLQKYFIVRITEHELLLRTNTPQLAEVFLLSYMR